MFKVDEIVTGLCYSYDVIYVWSFLIFSLSLPGEY